MTRLIRCSVLVSGSTPTNWRALPIGPRSRAVRTGEPAARILEDDDLAAFDRC